MSQHARIEEVSDSDLDSDPEIMDPTALAPNEIIAPSRTLIDPKNIPSTSPAPPAETRYVQQQKLDHTYATIYPLYFDAAATRAQGRRVGSADAVRNPLAKGLADALSTFTRQIVLEPGKRHPKDWANPGRVKVKCYDEGGKWALRGVKNKRHLYKKVSEHLKAHPTTANDPHRLPVRGLPLPEDGVIPPPAVPRGWRVNEILPLHSAAVTGGGVSDNIMKDIQAAMMGQEPGAAPPKIEAKKEKKKKKGAK
ncbi:signal recognition particle, SRP19 subunit [Microthyrium microscopicum]|uniref:Signal recognition particle, SRP19 subunit n=1 Tax=Microthyrium microscopicum TaxID=703497 RepID=A0A6A6UPN8_9PEZI|nr:signal recognition particle, SRP19 subunit [Microthyrium microscopicum]